ncbi:MAG: endonuclease/exonuclease/phosphatase family protein, partial [Candidatus Handelsmanbacteria bacterium]|nr:endonuclease/exonuclease/phosphatase family protein [Candidatus Handelsmanbacteria bacterium]
MGLRAKLFALAGLLQLAGALPHHARAADLTLASFNIRIYSTGSRTEAELEKIADRLQQFDLIAVQEVRDQAVVARTLAILQARGHSFQAIVSEAVGRGVNERYAFLWRPGKVQALDPGAFFPDPDDAFIREPFIGSFRAGAFDLTLATMHTLFGDTVAGRRAEDDLLAEVYQVVQDADPQEQDVLLLGDFNLPPEDRGFDRLRALLTPLFTGEIRTTISDASLYDNIWFEPQFVQEYTGQAGVDRFDETAFGGDDDAASAAVSDHRPVWAKFRTDGPDDDGDGSERVPTTAPAGTWGEAKQGPAPAGGAGPMAVPGAVPVAAAAAAVVAHGAPAGKVAAKKASAKDQTVYVTKSGKKYHRAGCRFLAKSQIPMGLDEAAARYGPCGVCSPPVPGKEDAGAGADGVRKAAGAAGRRCQLLPPQRQRRQSVFRSPFPNDEISAPLPQWTLCFAD